ncbi:carbonic anhydrase 4-like [Hyperolius riggenbachi]|uniref:carbonic anhydrase 4-like n=1 Tax=Hyperolius riggenbachi TaxID=752182 RepID=UPI0035A33F54
MIEVGVTDAIPTNVLLGTDLGRLVARYEPNPIPVKPESPPEVLDPYWCYTESSCGPSTWQSLGFCNGTQQSPINIPESSALYNGSLGVFTFNNYSDPSKLLTITNTGHTVEVAIDSGVSMSGGGLPAGYSAIAFHFHWGNGTSGSEHQLSGKQYPIEMHVVHTKGGVSLTDAKKDPTGIAVLGFFIDVSTTQFRIMFYVMDSANASQLGGLSGLLGQVSIPGTTLTLNSTFSLDGLLANVNRTMYYRYSGSLTTPTCDQVVVWTVFKQPIYVPSGVVQNFTSALKHNASGNMETMVNNFRPLQSLNGRQVQVSFTTFSSTVTSNVTAKTTVASNVTATTSSSSCTQYSVIIYVSLSLQFLSQWTSIHVFNRNLV